jgi:hypothetical protein
MNSQLVSIIGLALVSFLASGCGPLGTPLTPLGRASHECRTNPDCRAQELCQKKWGDCEGVGQCQERPTLIDASLGPPVCGCDGQTYRGFFSAASQGITVAYEGKCKGEP